MAIRVTCADCGHKFSAPDNRAGKTVACEECDETVRVPLAKAGTGPAKAVPVAKASPVAKSVKKKVVVDDDEIDDDDETPRSRQKPAEAVKKSALPMLLIAGGVLLLLVGGGGAAVFFLTKDAPPAVVASPTGPMYTGNPMPPDTKPESKPTTPDPKPTPATKPDSKPIEPKPVEPKPVEPKPVEPKPVARRDTPDKATFDRMAHATVYIEVEDQRGGGSSGSGWFGLENNLVVTNAHVLGMKAPGSKEPKKITVYVDAGEKGKQQKFEGQKVKILAVDRDMDLALLEIINVPNLPKPLKLRPSEELDRLEKLTVLGYPGGRRIADRNRSDDPPTVTISETKVQALRKDAFGDLYSVQVQGGVVHGNSGGPICDGEGDVVGVAVRVDLDSEGRFTNIAYGVPTEYVRGLIAGRIANVEYGAAFNQDGKTHMPVTVNCLDPRKQLKEVGMACWLGEAEDGPRSPGMERMAKETDTDLIEIKLAYDPAKQVATGELVFPAQQAGRVFFSQPYYSNALVSKRWMGGNLVKLDGPPYERKATDLSARYKIGSKRPLTVKRTSDLQQLQDGEGTEKERQVLLEQTIKLTEELGKAADTSTLARVVYRFDSMDLKIKRGNKEIPAPQEILDFINSGIKLVTATGTVARTGEIFNLLVQTFNINDPFLKQIYVSQGQELVESLQESTIALPNKKVTPGDTWTAVRNLRLAFEAVEAAPPPGGGRPTAPPKSKPKDFAFREDLKYTYLGLRDRGGRREAVVKVEGTINPMAGATPGSATGTVKGTVLIEEETGVIVDSDIKRHFEIDSSERGIKKRLTGIDEFKITRGANVN